MASQGGGSKDGASSSQPNNSKSKSNKPREGLSKIPSGSSHKIATITIAPKEGTKSVGPGDPNAAPSSMPEPVDIPAAPTPSQLIVKSVSGAPSTGATGPSAVESSSAATGGPSVASPSAAATGQSVSAASTGKPMTAEGEVIHDEDEEGEGETEHLDSPATGTQAPVGPGVSSLKSTGGVVVSRKSSAPHFTASADKQASSRKSVASAPGEPISAQASAGSRRSPSSSELGVGAPVSEGGGLAKASTRTSSQRKSPVDGPSKPASPGGAGKAKKKKVTKFRYHKRITVRTKGNQSPSAIMDKVNLKDHKATLTPSTIEDIDPQELMRRAGIKGNNKTHWRVRLRQTKRLTKNGKTTTQTKVAYRDSDGNKRIKTVTSPFCKHCGKRVEECKCEANSKSEQ